MWGELSYAGTELGSSWWTRRVASRRGVSVDLPGQKDIFMWQRGMSIFFWCEIVAKMHIHSELYNRPVIIFFQRFYVCCFQKFNTWVPRIPFGFKKSLLTHLCSDIQNFLTLWKKINFVKTHRTLSKVQQQVVKTHMNNKKIPNSNMIFSTFFICYFNGDWHFGHSRPPRVNLGIP